ncbi:hypothetical protein QOZ96_001084 [Brevundimonas nasdae]|uniref:hypothetical protein n=1 Tax=Brevundimonas nasdae TaxID=172043 RepID=UPI001911B989|nr:hypothetical protein [Brevundimonas nasdae]MBK6024494.1 hypothetical protein [Brevundimonas nasdae]MDQ0451153.1 hypothetical protein [Brevundimonas nasdae]
MTDPMELVERLEKITAKPAGPGGIIRAKKRDLIEAAACIRELVEWRPIETAPLDRTEVVVMDGLGVYGGAWFHPREAEWIDCGGCVPTHWLPLPPPPADRGGV